MTCAACSALRLALQNKTQPCQEHSRRDGKENVVLEKVLRFEKEHWGDENMD